MPYGGTVGKWNYLKGGRVSLKALEIEPLELGEFIEVEGWHGEVMGSATVRWLRGRADPDIVVAFAPLPHRAVEVRSLALEGAPDRPVKSADLRGFQFRQLTNALVTFLATTGSDSLSFDRMSISQMSRDDLERAKEAQRNRPHLSLRLPELDDDLLEVLATPEGLAELRANGPRSFGAVEIVNALLDTAARDGVSPHTLVRETLGLPKATATRWITIARQLQDAGDSRTAREIREGTPRRDG